MSKQFRTKRTILSVDSVPFHGQFAAPIVKSELTLGNFIPTADDSTIWAEVDPNGLLHIRMYLNAGSFKVNEIFDQIIYPVNTGYPVPADYLVLQTDTLRMKAYNNFLAGHLFFEDPKITLKFYNQIPLVTYFRLDTLTFHDNLYNAMSHTDHTNYAINAPLVQGNTALTDIVIDKNVIPILPDVFSPIPNFISFYITVGSSEVQDLPFNVTGQEVIKMDADIDLPMKARLENLVMTDTVDINWGNKDEINTDTISELKSASIRIEFKNGFPVDGVSQIYFADSTELGDIGFIVDSVFTDLSHPNISKNGWHLEAAKTNSQGIVTADGAKKSSLTVTLDRQRIQKLKNSDVSKLLIKGTLNTFLSENQHHIRIMANYKMGVRIAVLVEYEGTVGGLTNY